MDDYRQSLAGRALADVLQELERDGSLDARDGDTIFELFDAAMREELRAAGSKKQRADAAAPPAAADASPYQLRPPVFTHETLVLRARVESYNRFHDKWSISAMLQDGSDDESAALTLDRASLMLPPPRSARMLLKLHNPASK